MADEQDLELEEAPVASATELPNVLQPVPDNGLMAQIQQLRDQQQGGVLGGVSRVLHAIANPEQSLAQRQREQSIDSLTKYAGGLQGLSRDTFAVEAARGNMAGALSVLRSDLLAQKKAEDKFKAEIKRTGNEKLYAPAAKSNLEKIIDSGSRETIKNLINAGQFKKAYDEKLRALSLQERGIAQGLADQFKGANEQKKVAEKGVNPVITSFNAILEQLKAKGVDLNPLLDIASSAREEKSKIKMLREATGISDDKQLKLFAQKLQAANPTLRPVEPPSLSNLGGLIGGPKPLDPATAYDQLKSAAFSPKELQTHQAAEESLSSANETLKVLSGAQAQAGKAAIATGQPSRTAARGALIKPGKGKTAASNEDRVRIRREGKTGTILRKDLKPTDEIVK